MAIKNAESTDQTHDFPKGISSKNRKKEKIELCQWIAGKCKFCVFTFLNKNLNIVKEFWKKKKKSNFGEKKSQKTWILSKDQ